MQHARKIETVTRLVNSAQPLPANYKPYNPAAFHADAEIMPGVTASRFWRRTIVGLAVFWGSILWAIFR